MPNHKIKKKKIQVDEGSSLAAKQDNIWTLVGIVTGNCKTQGSSWITRAATYRNWIARAGNYYKEKS